MTEAEWQECEDPQAMLASLQETDWANDRKLRLSAVACCRRICHLLTDERSRRAVEISERYADGLAPKSKLRAAARRAEAVDFVDEQAAAEDSEASAAYEALTAAWITPTDNATTAASQAAGAAADAIGDETCADTQDPAWKRARNAERATQAALLRCIFGPSPFRPPPPLPPSCLTPDVTSLVTTIYERRSFDRLRELADALAAAGCTEAKVLAHCRSHGSHARGCWVVDLILAKA
jgi:hypothetical protein